MRFAAVHTRGPRRALAGALIAAAIRRRRRMDDTWFVGVTGSCGKTTTKELVAAVLSRRYQVARNHGSFNSRHRAAMTMLRTPRGGACVMEVATSAPGEIAATAAVLRPQIAVVTHVMRDHYNAFRSQEAIAAEKGALIAALPDNGVAVLNADDPRVRAMAALTRARVLTFGVSDSADVRAEDVRGAWPGRLEATLVCDGERCPIRTQMVGGFWISAVLAAVAVGKAAGLSLREAGEAVGQVEPIRGRLSIAALPDGVTFIEDDKAAFDSIPAVLDVLRQARSQRRIIVFGNLSDYPGNSWPRYRDVALNALEAADVVVFAGRVAHEVLAKRRARFGERLLVFDTVYAAHRFLREYFAAGDLVVLKGSHRTDHLERMVLARGDGIACWRLHCGRVCRCEDCRLRWAAFIPRPGEPPAPAPEAAGPGPESP